MCDATCLFLLGGHGLPLVGNHLQQLRVGQVRVRGLELLADLVLEDDVGRRGALRRVGVLGLGVALALLRAILVLRRECSLSLALGEAVERAWVSKRGLDTRLRRRRALYGIPCSISAVSGE